MTSTLGVLSVVSCLTTFVAIFSTSEPNILKTTSQRIQEYGYPVEEHTVVTSDGYILTLFRIPYSQNLQNMNETKPVVFLQHGFIYSSDSCITNGPDDALAFLFADAGYDVWLGNSRGNTYSRRHTDFLSNDPCFWDFSWHEIALFDLPACIDHILEVAGQPNLYYVGHSQGTTIFFVLMSIDPSYNEKIKIGFMLAPVGYIDHSKSPLLKITAPLAGRPSTLALTQLIGVNEILPSNELIALLGSAACSEKLPFQDLCLLPYFLTAGFDYKYFNYTMLSDIRETFPSGSSAKQGLHFLQEYNSGHFRQYDYGMIDNLRRYNQTAPPDYDVEKITAKVVLYYSANDWFVSIVDVKRLAARLNNVIEDNLIPVPEWNHFDFIWAIIVKDQLNDKIIKTANENEAK